MLTLYSDKISRNCQSYSRRELLKIGTLGLGGLSLPQVLAEEAKGYVKDKTVVMLNMQGGPSLSMKLLILKWMFLRRSVQFLEK